YVALSYCWGTLTEKDKAFLTTKSNIKARLSGLKLQNLPRTLQDAVRTTQALGVDYIWIDSICIIQDDTDDWEREAITMGKVYKHACFTIAATNSSSSLDGFLHHRKPSAKASLPFFFSVVQDIFPGITDVEAERGNFHFRYPVETGIIDHLSECDWKKRGWTLQEEILSTRILSFTKDVIHFRCMRSEEVEASGYFGPLPLRFPALLADMEAMPFAKRLNGDSDYHYGWYEIIEDYSKRTLSYPGDKLAAVGGLAETFESLINDTYICGLWKSDLHRGLLWQSVSMSDIRGENGAPSWSWASRDGSITW
ncbi:heterokaryon incompatibility protein-domain-containing protein, partial [Clohesyomyces aquaticus]